MGSSGGNIITVIVQIKVYIGTESSVLTLLIDRQ